MHSDGRSSRTGPINRLVAYLVTLFLAITLNFFLPRVMPGDPLALVAGNSVRQMGAENIAQLRQTLGMDRPLGEQYLRYLGQLARGDLGQSYRFSGGRSVLEVVGDRFLWTLSLVLASLAIATFLGALLGAWAAWRHGEWRDVGLLSAFFTLRAVPPFWLAMILIPIFAVQWRLLPVGDSYSFPRPDGLQRVTDTLYHAILPLVVLTLAYIPTPFAIMRTSMLGVIGSDFILTARAKGLPERAVLLRHAVRVALLPLVTIVALDFGQLLGGVLVIETVFNYRGLGSMMFEAVKGRDYPLLQGGFLFFTAGVVTMNLLADLLYGQLDPRVRGGGR